MDGPARPALFLDRDGVLNRDLGYPHLPEQIEWTPGVFEAVARANRAGWLVFVVTNQSGVARGLFDEAAVMRLHAWMDGEFARHGARIDAWSYCPHHPTEGVGRYRRDCACRKPSSGMLYDLMERFPIDRDRSVLIGDKASDLEAAAGAGVRGVLFEGGDLGSVVAGLIPSLEWEGRDGATSPPAAN